MNRIEDLADGEWRRGVLPDQAEPRLLFGRRRILHPEQMIRLEALAEACRLDRRQPVMHVVQQMESGPNSLRSRSNSDGTKSRYRSLLHRVSGGRPFSAGS